MKDKKEIEQIVKEKFENFFNISKSIYQSFNSRSNNDLQSAYNSVNFSHPNFSNIKFSKTFMVLMMHF